MPFTSPYVERAIPEVDVWNFLFEDRTYSLGVPEDRVIFVDGIDKTSVTYGEYVELARQFGSGLMKNWGWKKQEVLLVFSKNHIDWATITAGVQYAGGTSTAASAMLSVDGLTAQLKDSNAKALVTQEDLLHIAEAAANNVGINKEKILVMGKGSTGKSWRSMLVTDILPHPTIDPLRDISHIIYTSGSTGIPKGCMFTHRSIVAQFLMFDFFDTPDAPPEEARTALFLPFFHVYGMTVRDLFAWKGLLVVVMPSFSLPTLCSLIEEYKLTWLHGTPPVFKLLLSSPDVAGYDLSSLKRGMSAGSVLSIEDTQLFYKRFNVPVQNALGMTECVAAVASNLHQNAVDTAGSVGYLMPGSSGKVIGENNEEVGTAGTPGRLFVKNPCVMLGYKNKPLVTEKTIGPDGYVDSGDFVSVTNDGLITVLGRNSEIIRFRGDYIIPTEIEEAICSHPKVSDCAVVALEGEIGSTANPRAFVVPATTVLTSDDVATEIISFVASKLPEVGWLRGGVEFTQLIPRSAAGKTLRDVLKREYLTTKSNL